MSFTDHKIQKFTQRIADLPDEPNLSAEELKRCFDSAPEQLRQAVNGLCDEAERLDTRVEGIVAQTYEDTIHESMLDTPLQEKINSKADERDLAAVTDRVTANEALTAQKCEVYCGTYIGDGAETRIIELGFTPKAVFCLQYGSSLTNSIATSVYGGIALPDHPVVDIRAYVAMEITEGGFQVYCKSFRSSGTTYRMDTNVADACYHFLALQ